MYWTSDRIYEDIDSWDIFVYLEDNTPIGSIYCLTSEESLYEIFGIDILHTSDKHQICKDLLNACLKAAKDKGVNYICFFSDDEYEQDVIDSGFKLIGRYNCFKIILQRIY